MPVKLECPRCAQSLSVPVKKAGSYANCPRCNGRFWVREDAAQSGIDPSGSGAPATMDVGMPTATPPRTVAEPPSERSSISMRDAPPSPEAEPAVPVPSDSQSPSQPLKLPGRKVARFVTAEAAQSKLEVAEDGNLPSLRLQEGQQAKEPVEKSTSVNPLVLFAVLCMSVALSVLLVSTDIDSQDPFESEKARAREVIREEYFANLDDTPLAAYQLDLREAQRAHARGDFETERELHRKVLKQLRSERGRFGRGLTGSRSRDARLEGQLSTLLLSD